MKRVWKYFALLSILLLHSCSANHGDVKTNQSVALHAFPSLNSNVLLRLRKGEGVEYFFSINKWCLVKHQQLIGFLDCQTLPLPKRTGSLINKTIFIDPGHGGKENGASYFGTNEKDVNYQLAHQVGQLLTQEGANVIYTRVMDETIHLYTRDSIANLASAMLLYITTSCSKIKQELEPYITEFISIIEENSDDIPLLYRKDPVTHAINPRLADFFSILNDKLYHDHNLIFISIHNNSTKEPNESIRGSEVIITKNSISDIYPGYQIYNDALRESVSHALTKALKKADILPFRKEYDGNYAILREQTIPSALVEVGYLNNKEDFKILTNKAKQLELANAIANGIKDWLLTVK